DYGITPGEVDRYNMQRVVSFTANLEGKPLGQTLNDVRLAIARAGAPPRGVNVFNRGQVPAFEETLAGLRSGVLLAIVVIFLLLAANFQSFHLSIAVVSTVPAVICGVLLMLLLTGTTLKYSVVHGRNHGDWHLGSERDSAGIVRRAGPHGGRISARSRR